MDKLMGGIARFKNDIFPKRKELFAELATGQEPEALFITCSDSRIDPNLITQTDPGDLFICRNAGNIVPPHSLHTGGMTASIEYAIAVLGIKHVVICGHTDCGAMKGALNPDSVKELPHVAEWLGHCNAALKTVKDNYPELEKEEQLQRMIEQNVLVQLQHIRTHPCVAARLEADKITLHGWVYDIGLGGFKAYDEQTKTFEPLLMADEIKAINSKKHA